MWKGLLSLLKLKKGDLARIDKDILADKRIQELGIKKEPPPFFDPDGPPRYSMSKAWENRTRKESLLKAQAYVDDLIKQGEISVLNEEDKAGYIYAYMKAFMSKAYSETLKKAGLGGAAGIAYAGMPGQDEAIQEMEEATQTTPTFRENFESGQWGEPVANILMDVISPIPRYK